MPTNEDVIGQIKGLSVEELLRFFSKGDAPKWWRELEKRGGTAAQKKLILKAEIKGADDVDDLVKAMNEAVGASEEFFEKIKKYRSTVNSMNLAWKEGAAHMKDYLDAARKTGGQMAVLGAATSYLGETLKKSMESIEDSVLALHRYNIEQETFARTTRYSVDDIKTLRNELFLTKEEMEDFFIVLKKSSALGLDTSKIKTVYKQLRDVYGKGAGEKMGAFTELLPVSPTMRIKFMADPSSELDADTIHRIVGTGSVSKLVELRAAGLFGGKKEESASATFENTAHKLEAIQERVKDEFMKHLPHQAVLLAGISGLIATSVLKLTQIVGVAGGIHSLVGELLRIQGYTGGGLGRGLRLSKSAQMIGAGASVYGGYLASAALRGGASSMAGVESGGDGLSQYAGTAIDSLSGLLLAKSLLPRGIGKWLGKRGVASIGGNLLRGLRGAKGLFTGGRLLAGAGGLGLTSAGAASFLGVNQLMAHTYGKAQHGYAPGIGEQFRAVMKYGLPYKAEGMSESQPTMGTKGIAEMQEEIKVHKEMLEQAGGDIQEENRRFAETAKGLAGATGNLKSYIEEMGKIGDAIRVRDMQESSYYSGKIALIKNEMKAIEKTNKNYKTDTDYIVLQKQLEEVIFARNEVKAKSLEDFRNLLESYNEIAEWGEKGKGAMLKLQRGVLGAKGAIEAARMGGGAFEATLAGKAPMMEMKGAQISNVNVALSKVRESLKNEKDEARIIELTAQENSLLEKKADLQRELNDIMLDTSAFDILSDRLRKMNETLMASSEYVREIDGSYEALAPLWKQEVENKKKDLEITKAAFEEMKKRGLGEGAEEYKAKTEEIRQKEIDIARSTLDYAKRVRDAKMEEVNIAHDWMNEQADFMEDMGGFFGDVLAKRTQAVQKERENIAFQEDFLKSSNLTGLERQKEEIKLEQMKMKVVKDTVGIQKSSYEKFVGLAFGALGDVGFKKGRMESVLTMGKMATEVQNRAGLYTGAGVGMTRNEISALRATGFESPVGAGGISTSRGFSTGEALARRHTSMATSPEMKVGGQIEVSLSEDLRAKVKEWAIEVANDPQFGSTLIRSNGLVTVNNRANASSN